VLVNNTRSYYKNRAKIFHEAKEKIESESVILELKNILDELRECTVIVVANG
jgi:hypothetical protein